MAGRVTDPVARFVSDAAALDRAYSPGHHGRWSAERRSGLLDACLTRLFEDAGAPSGIALGALGGYGRRMQMPHSDVDVLLVHEGLPTEEIESLARTLFYPLWDAGLTLGQAVRTPAECMAAADGRLDTFTAMLDARLLVGDGALFEQALLPVRENARAAGIGFVKRLQEAAAARRAKFGSAGHLLEPDVKESTGGLRDIASLGWLSAAMHATSSAAGHSVSRERDAVEAAEEFLVRVRSTLHLQTGRRADRLALELQPDVAQAMGFDDEPGLLAPDGLLRTLFEHARQVEHIVGSNLDRSTATSIDAAREPATEVPALGSAGDVLTALADAVERDAAPTASLLEAIEQFEVPDPLEWTPSVRGAFMRLIRSGPKGMRALDVLDRTGALTRYVPAWAAVRCRPQRDPYHRSTVDTHLMDAVERMHALLHGGSDDPIESEAVRRSSDNDALLLGALLHDIGKVGVGNHVPVGTRIAEETLTRMGVPAATRELATFMVAEHLLLPDTATRRDLGDENLILDVAARAGTTERLAALFLLAKADAEATGPAAWTPWRRALIRELVTKVEHVLQRGDMGEELAARLADRMDRLRDLLADEPDAEVDRFVLRMPRAYFLSADPAEAARHFRTIAPDIGSNEVRTTPVDGKRPGTYELLVVAADRPGLLSWIAGSLSLGGISILSAQVFTTSDGTAVDLFEVEGTFEAEITEARWREFRSTLRRVIDGSISLERRVEDKSTRYPRPAGQAPLTVQIDNDASDFSTVVEVGAADRIGLLYVITRAFADLRLDVHLAKVATFEGRVVDAFYVRDALGRKITDAKQLAEIESVVRDRLG